MTISTRSHLVAGVAVLGVGAATLSPLQPASPRPLPPIGSPVAHAVQLTAFDIVTPWLELFNNSTKNVANAFNDFLGYTESSTGNGGDPLNPVEFPPNRTTGAPLVIVQQLVANALRYTTELPDIGGIFSQVFDNIGAAIRAPFVPNLFTLDQAHFAAYGLVGGLPVAPPQWLVDILTTSLSGMLIGAVGPVLAPVLSVVDGVRSAIGKLTGGTTDIAGALADLVNIPARAINAFLNGGGFLNLTALAPALGFPAEITRFGFELGGLLSPGSSAFNSVTFDFELVPGFPPLTFQGVQTGFLGSLLQFPWKVARSIGWNGRGNPLQPGIPVPGGGAAVAAAAAVEAAAPAVAAESAVLQAAPEAAARQAGVEDRSAGAPGVPTEPQVTATSAASEHSSTAQGETPAPEAEITAQQAAIPTQQSETQAPEAEAPTQQSETQAPEAEVRTQQTKMQAPKAPAAPVRPHRGAAAERKAESNTHGPRGAASVRGR